MGCPALRLLRAVDCFNAMELLILDYSILPCFAALPGAAAFLRSEGNCGAGSAALASATGFLSSERRTSATTELAGASCLLMEPSGECHSWPPPSSLRNWHATFNFHTMSCSPQPSTPATQHKRKDPLADSPAFGQFLVSFHVPSKRSRLSVLTESMCGLTRPFLVMLICLQVPACHQGGLHVVVAIYLSLSPHRRTLQPSRLHIPLIGFISKS
uniref:Uncharacterized protein n=2 Tax=Oryza meridionalis TaxID=40149 RepID=A0A0E0EXB2_9ORYZ